MISAITIGYLIAALVSCRRVDREVSAAWESGGDEMGSMDRFAGRTVADSKAGYDLIEERRHNHPQVGEKSPDFELPLYDGAGTVRLSSFRGARPVVLIFGSLT